MNASSRQIRSGQIGWILSSLLAYLVFRAIRTGLSEGLVRDAFPSLLCPSVLLPVLRLIRGYRGVEAVASGRHEWTCAVIALILLEGCAPMLGRGTADVSDAVAFLIGAWFQHIVVRCPWAGGTSV